MADAVAGMKDAFRQLSAGQADVPLRPRIRVPAHDGVTLFMPAFVPDTDTPSLAIRLSLCLTGIHSGVCP